MSRLQVELPTLDEYHASGVREDSVTSLFQPIVEVGSSTQHPVVAVEALSRGPHRRCCEPFADLNQENL